jgi:hypothetical protein
MHFLMYGLRMRAHVCVCVQLRHDANVMKKPAWDGGDGVDWVLGMVPTQNKKSD